MNFSDRDIAIVVSMSVAIILMSFVMPAVGLTGDTASEPPTFNMTSDRFDFAGDFPDNPGAISKGSLEYNDSKVVQSLDNQVWLEGDSSGGAELLATNTGSSGQIEFIVWENGGIANSSTLLFNATGYETIQEAGYTIEFEITEFNGTYPAYEVDYEVTQRPTSDGGFISSIPLVGGIFDAGAQLAGIVGWIGSIIWWFATTLFTVTLNLMGILYDGFAFFAGLMVYLGSTYSALITGASSWASIILAIPGLLLGLEFAKLSFVAISLLPTT